MRKATAVFLGILLPLLGLAEIGRAQSSVQVQGTLQTVECRTQTLMLGTADTSNTVSAATYTAVLVNSTIVPFCALRQYIGSPVTVWLLASGAEFTATRIDVVDYATVTPPLTAAAVAAPLPIVGVVVGTIVVGGLPYLLAGDHDGRFYRYPYYGPYHAYYYRPGYRPYHGPHFDAPLRQGDPTWDAPVHSYGNNQRNRGSYEPAGPVPPAYRDGRNNGIPGYRDPGGSAPEWRGPQGRSHSYQDASRQNRPSWDPSLSQNGHRQVASNGDRHDQRCFGHASDHPCADDGMSFPRR